MTDPTPAARAGCQDAPEWFTRSRQEHEARLVVGARVRVDVGECPHFLVWHGTVEQGVRGMILAIDAIPAAHPPDHRYTVLFDRPLRARATWDYAAHELEVAPWQTPDEIVRETLAWLTTSGPASDS